MVNLLYQTVGSRREEGRLRLVLNVIYELLWMFDADTQGEGFSFDQDLVAV